MFISTTNIRVHYALTDQMGFVYYGHYAQFYEIGRTEAIRQLGFTYKDVEALGIIMPVVEMKIKFLRPAKYDDLLTIKTTLKEMPNGHTIIFHGEVFNEAGQLLNRADVTLYSMQLNGMKRVELPLPLRERLASYFVVE
jgi:acyl-CoA thioester hydrolase